MPTKKQLEEKLEELKDLHVSRMDVNYYRNRVKKLDEVSILKDEGINPDDYEEESESEEEEPC